MLRKSVAHKWLRNWPATCSRGRTKRRADSGHVVFLLVPSFNPDADHVTDWYRKNAGTEYEEPICLGFITSTPGTQ